MDQHRRLPLGVMVITETGGCIEGATIQIVRAEGAGERIPQKTPAVRGMMMAVCF